MHACPSVATMTHTHTHTHTHAHCANTRTQSNTGSIATRLALGPPNVKRRVCWPVSRNRRMRMLLTKEKRTKARAVPPTSSQAVGDWAHFTPTAPAVSQWGPQEQAIESTRD